MGWKSRWDDDDELQRSTRRVVRLNCKTEEVELGKFIRKCEKTEQIFRQTAGRPEIVESNTEHTEEDVTNEMTNSTFSFDYSSTGPFSFPELGGEIEAITRSVFGGFGDFLETIDEMKNKMRDIFGNPRDNRDPSPFSTRVPIDDGRHSGASPQEGSESTYGDFAGEVRDDASHKDIDSIYDEFAGKVRDV